MVMGGTWRTPVAVGLQSKSFLSDQKQEGTYNEASFQREYESIWSGSAEGAFYNSEYFVRNRKLLSAEFENNNKSAATYYIISVDVGRKKCATVACIFKVAP